MRSLPRITRRTRSRGSAEVVARTGPVARELTASGLTWVNAVGADVEIATALAERFGWHPLDVEDVVSKRQRPKVDDYEEEGYLFSVLHFPVYDKTIQRLNAAELDLFIGQDYLVTIPNRELLPVSRLFTRCESDDEFREQLFAKGGSCTRCSTTCSTTASRSSTRSVTS
jgi:magnesium transporter